LPALNTLLFLILLHIRLQQLLLHVRGTGLWYSLSAKPTTYKNSDPIGMLDVTILSTYALDNVLNIKDLRTDKRIDFVGGIL
jgi:uncharacterized protein (DUF1015 family)